RILDEEEEAARSILERHRDVLANLTAALVSQETLQGVELERMLADVAPFRRDAVKVATNGSRAPRKAATRAPKRPSEGE
ncbi:MAG: hypothetical protein KY447_10985, partial [Actinobacteria bacterium]|nr:hypothetical protein [Actinomycetota bacterium]